MTPGDSMTLHESLDDAESVDGGELALVPPELEAWVQCLALAITAGAKRMGPANDVGEGPEVMDADQTAAFLGVDRKTVYDYANRGAIPHQRLGKRLLFSRSGLVAWLSSCKAASARKG